MKPYNIMIVPAWYDPKNMFEGVFIHQFCEALQRQGHNVTLLYVKVFSLKQVFSYFKKISFAYTVNYRVLILKKINIYPVSIFSKGNQLFKIALLKKLKQITNGKQYDVVHAQSVCNNITPYLGSELAKYNKQPYLITEHYTSFTEAGDKVFEPYITFEEVKQIVAKADKRVAVSDFAAKNFSGIFNTDFISIPNIISESFFKTPFREITSEVGKPFKFIFIGGLTARKGIMELLKAFQQLSEKETHAQLTLIGDGESYAEASSFIKQNNFTGSVNLLGKKNEKEIIEQLDAHHCLVSASEVETFGLVIAETFLRGRPVIAVNSGAVAELISAENGILCSAENKIQTMADAMADMINNYITYNQMEIKHRAEEKFNERAIVEQYGTLYGQLIQKHA